MVSALGFVERRGKGRDIEKTVEKRLGVSGYAVSVDDVAPSRGGGQSMVEVNVFSSPYTYGRAMELKDAVAALSPEGAKPVIVPVSRRAMAETFSVNMSLSNDQFDDFMRALADPKVPTRAVKNNVSRTAAQPSPTVR